MTSSGKAGVLLLPRSTRNQNDHADDRADDDEEDEHVEQKHTQRLRRLTTVDPTDLRGPATTAG